MATFTTTEISGIASAIKWMRFPMGSEGDSGRVEYPTCSEEDMFGMICVDSDGDINEADCVGEKDKKLMKILASAKAGSGHDCYLKTITVHFEAEAPHYWWNQAQRYHFWDIASSTSKMHSITKGDIGDKCSKWVSNHTVELVNDLIELHSYVTTDREVYEEAEYRGMVKEYSIVDFPKTKEELFECILDNTPLGYELKAGMVTNYLQLKTVYAQRKNHKLSHWNTDFVAWIKTLPLNHLITGEDDE